MWQGDNLECILKSVAKRVNFFFLVVAKFSIFSISHDEGCF